GLCPWGRAGAVPRRPATGLSGGGATGRVAGLYNSGLVGPPVAISTLPLGSSVAVCPDWATPSGPVATNVFGGPSPPAVAAAAVGASTGMIRPETRAPGQGSTAMRGGGQGAPLGHSQRQHARQPTTTQSR